MAKKKYSKTLLKEICKHIEAGLSARDSTMLAGICEDTFYTWLDKEDKNNPLTDKEHAEFSEAIKLAKVKRKKKLVQNITRAGRKQWQASAWLLEKTEPAEYGKKEEAPNGGDPTIAAPQTEREAELSAVLLKKYHDLKQKPQPGPSATDIALT